MQATHTQTNKGDKKQAIYNLFAAYLHAVPLPELIDSFSQVHLASLTYTYIVA